MKLFITLLFLLNSIAFFAQTEPKQDTIYTYEDLDVKPQFDRGKRRLSSFLQKNVHYLKNSRKQKVEGKVLAQFVIETNGEVSNAKIIQGMNEECDSEVLRTIKLMPKWSPGQKNNQNVRSYYNLPVRFEW